MRATSDSRPCPRLMLPQNGDRPSAAETRTEMPKPSRWPERLSNEYPDQRGRAVLVMATPNRR